MELPQPWAVVVAVLFKPTTYQGLDLLAVVVAEQLLDLDLLTLQAEQEQWVKDPTEATTTVKVPTKVVVVVVQVWLVLPAVVLAMVPAATVYQVA